MCKPIQNFIKDSASKHASGAEGIRPEPTPDQEKPERWNSFPTESRMKQKEKHKQHKVATGEKFIPKKKPKIIGLGHDDCGEDEQSITFIDENTKPLWQERQTKGIIAERTLNFTPEAELFLTKIEGSMSPGERTALNDQSDAQYSNFAILYQRDGMQPRNTMQ